MRPNAFPRERRLKRRLLIRPLFDRARPDVGRVRVGTVQVLYRTVPREDTGCDVPLQVGFAPGRRARTNAGRTRLRRLMREAFRLHQRPLLDRLDGRPTCLTLFVAFRGNEANAARDIPRDVPEALRRLDARLARVEATDDDPLPGGNDLPAAP